MPKYRTREEPLSPEEVQRMVDDAHNDRDKALVGCLYLLGARITEVITLRKSDVEITDKKVIFKIKPLKRRKEKGPVRYKHKLAIPIDAPFMDIFVKWAGGIQQEDGFLFPGYNPHLTRERAWQIINKLNPDAWPHLFRHYRLNWVYDHSKHDLIATRDWAGRITLPVEYLGTRSTKLDKIARDIS